MTTQLPNGYQTRPVTLDDVAAFTELFNAYSHSLIGADQTTQDELRIEWKEPTFDLANDTLAIWSPEGQPIAYMEFYDSGEPHVRLFAWGVVHPEHQGCGYGSYLLDWVINRARQNVAKAPEGTRVVLHQGVLDQNQAANELLQKKGFSYIRTFYQMRINLDHQPEPPVVPDGIVIRSITAGEERIAIQAAYDAFRDHWGFVEQPFDEYYKRWMHHLENDKDYDPALYFIATEGDEVAGVSLCYSKVSEDPDMAWVGTLGVRRNWRRRGLGLALLQHSFVEFHKRGKPRAGLGVDASSLTGATRLYERAGMYVARKSNSYELELRPGKDLSTQSI